MRASAWSGAELQVNSPAPRSSSGWRRGGAIILDAGLAYSAGLVASRFNVVVGVAAGLQ